MSDVLASAVSPQWQDEHEARGIGEKDQMSLMP